MQQRQLTRTNNQHGFTLIELLVVLVILGLLAGLVGATGIALHRQRKK